MAQPTFEQFAAESYVSLLTFRRNGSGVATPIWVAPDDGKLYAVTDGMSAKMKRLRTTGRVQLAPCDARGKVNGQWVDGHARRVEDPAVAARAMAALARKYGWQFKLVSLILWLFGRTSRRANIEITV